MRNTIEIKTLIEIYREKSADLSEEIENQFYAALDGDEYAPLFLVDLSGEKARLGIEFSQKLKKLRDERRKDKEGL